MIAVIYYPENNPNQKSLAACFVWAADASEYAKKESSNNRGMIFEMFGENQVGFFHETWKNGNQIFN